MNTTLVLIASSKGRWYRHTLAGTCSWRDFGIASLPSGSATALERDWDEGAFRRRHAHGPVCRTPYSGCPLTSNTTQRSSTPPKGLQSALAQSALSEAKDAAPNFYRCPASAGLRSLPLSLFHPTFFLTVRPNHLCLPSIPQGLSRQTAILIPCVFSSVCRLGVYVFWWLRRVWLCDPVDWSPWNFPGQNTGVTTFCFSMGSFQPRDGTQIYHTAGRFFTNWATREDQVVRGAMWESGM